MPREICNQRVIFCAPFNYRLYRFYSSLRGTFIYLRIPLCELVKKYFISRISRCEMCMTLKIRFIHVFTFEVKIKQQKCTRFTKPVASGVLAYLVVYDTRLDFKNCSLEYRELIFTVEFQRWILVIISRSGRKATRNSNIQRDDTSVPF